MTLKRYAGERILQTREGNIMPGMKYGWGVAAGILLVSQFATAADTVNTIVVDFGSVTLPLGQEKSVSDYFSQNQKNISVPPPHPAREGNHNEVSWRAVLPTSREKGADNSYFFDLPNLSGLRLRVQPEQGAASPSPGVTFGLVKTGDIPGAGTFGLTGPVFERIVTEKNQAGESLNTTTTQFTLRGNVTVPGCEFAQQAISVTMPPVTRQQLEQAKAGDPVGSGKQVNMGFRCAAQDNTFELRFTTVQKGLSGQNNRLLPALMVGEKQGGDRQSGVGFLVNVGKETADWGGVIPVNVTLDASRSIPLTIYYSRDGGPVTEGEISARGTISLTYP